jgi:hypothetical protein
LPNVLVECENALVGQEFYAHDRPRPLERSQLASESAPGLSHHYFCVLESEVRRWGRSRFPQPTCKLWPLGDHR